MYFAVLTTASLIALSLAAEPTPAHSTPTDGFARATTAATSDAPSTTTDSGSSSTVTNAAELTSLIVALKSEEGNALSLLSNTAKIPASLLSKVPSEFLSLIPVIQSFATETTDIPGIVQSLGTESAGAALVSADIQNLKSEEALISTGGAPAPTGNAMASNIVAVAGLAAWALI